MKMPYIHHILFPVDFSERCRAVQPLVKAMARRFDAKVTLLHALQIPATFYPGMETQYVVEPDLDAMRDGAEKKLASFYEVPRHPLPDGVQIVAEACEPALSIVANAEANNVDLIMLPTHGYGRFRRLLLGSVAAKVLHDTDCPVWTAAHTEDSVLASHANCENILCAIDLQPGSLDFLRRSVYLAFSFRARLRLVHAVPGAEPSVHMLPDADFRRFLLQAAREEMAKLQDQAGTDLEVCVAGGDVRKVVTAAAADHDADLIIIGRGRLHATLGRLRTNAYAIIRDSPCPVLSLPIPADPTRASD